MKNKKVIVITGPTAVGKSDIAVLVAKEINAEIISADSTQVYKNFNIGSGKITNQEMQGVKHHMLDILNFDEDFNVALYKKMAEHKIAEIFDKGKNVIICGGTGLYIKALVEGFEFYNVSKNEVLREELEEIYSKQGIKELYKILENLNPIKAKSVDKNNKVRIIRAIEIERSNNAKKAYEKPLYNYQIFVLNSEREVLYSRINARVDKMIDDGLENEVKNLIKQGATLSHNSFKSIGYKELYDNLSKNEPTTKETIDLIKQNSRKYAKRQLTWFRKIENTTWINVETKNNAAQDILKYITL